MRPFLGRFQNIVRGSSSQAALSLVCLFVLILGVRLSFPGPITEPDSDYYSKVAQNLVKHHCYGWVHGETCTPVWGNQPPGYPMFLAALQALGLQSLYYAVLAQTVIFAIAATYALWAAYTWHKSLATLLISGAILALSPVTIAWPRWVMTETLAGAAALWVFAEIFRSLALRRLRILRLSLALAAAILVRWDQIWLLIPAAACVIIYRASQSIQCVPSNRDHELRSRLLVFFMVLRAVILGLPLLPSVEEDLTNGARDFWWVAAKNQSFTNSFTWPIEDKTYENVASQFDYSSVAPGFDTSRLRALLNRISTLPAGAALPQKLDAELAELARNPSSEAWSHLYLVAYRAMAIWTQWEFLYESGWKTSNKPIGVENFARAYRIALLILVAALLFFLRGERLFMLGSLFSYVGLRTFFFASLGLLETRFLVPMFPSMELVLIAVAIPSALRVLNTGVEDVFTPRVDPADQGKQPRSKRLASPRNIGP
jgi:hypothetical protein